MTPIPDPTLPTDHSAEHQEPVSDDEITFAGEWTAEVLDRAALHFDVPARAVRRRMG